MADDDSDTPFLFLVAALHAAEVATDQDTMRRLLGEIRDCADSAPEAWRWTTRSAPPPSDASPPASQPVHGSVSSAIRPWSASAADGGGAASGAPSSRDISTTGSLPALLTVMSHESESVIS